MPTEYISRLPHKRRAQTCGLLLRYNCKTRSRNPERRMVPHHQTGTPLNKSSGGKERLGKITKKGDRYIRKLLVVGMTSRSVMAKRSPEKVDLWTAKIIADKPFRLATTAMVNKAARANWAMLTKKQEYRQPTF
ncbi:MAG: transposase [Roseobacter sp.]